MSISYSGIIGNKGKGTLPSVDSWSINNNILRDPPKSITTRRIDKVNQDGSLNEMLYHSGDRFAENILVYPRGVNPSVSVEYGNNNRAGNGSGSLTSGFKSGLTNGAPGKLPFRVMRDGAFRPPILRMEQLYPLSRQPRLVTQCFSAPYFVDYAKKAQCHENFRQIRDETLKAVVTPNKTVSFATPVKEHFEVKYVIESPIHAEVFANASGKSQIEKVNATPLRQALKQTLDMPYKTNVSENIGAGLFTHENDLVLASNTPHYSNQATKSSTFRQTLAAEQDRILTRNVPVHAQEARVTQNIHVANEPDQELTLSRNVPVYEVDAHAQSNLGVSRIELDENGEVKLDRNMPNYDFTAPKTDRVTHVQIEPENELIYASKTSAENVVANFSSVGVNNASAMINRDLSLPDTLPVGGYQNAGVQRMSHRESLIPTIQGGHHTRIVMSEDYASNAGSSMRSFKTRATQGDEGERMVPQRVLATRNGVRK